MPGKPTLLKVVLLGDGAVGKSSLMNRFVSDKFDSQSFHTIGVEFLNKDVSVENTTFTLQIWDTAGQERFKSLRTPFYRGTDICLLVYAVNDQQSLSNLAQWKKEFLYYADVKDEESFPFVVVGNKVDVENRVVSIENATAWCLANGNLPHFETSAKDNTNVELAFCSSVKRHLELEKSLDRQMKAIAPEAVVLSSHDRAKKESTCC